MKGRLSCAIALCAALGCGARAAMADPLDATFAITINALSGSHAVNSGQRDDLSFAPLPLGELVLKDGNESLRVEGLVPVTIRYGGSEDGAQSTQLAIVNATYRHAFRGGWFIGAGQTLYDQSTTYAPTNGGFHYSRGSIIDPIYGSEVQYSRVTGPRIEIGRIVSGKRDHLEVFVAANIRMHGVQYTQIPTLTSFCLDGATVVRCDRAVHTYADPENAGQIDVTARIAHRVSKHGELLYGLRYLNYTAHYDSDPGELADRNVGWAPVIGYRVKL